MHDLEGQTKSSFLFMTPQTCLCWSSTMASSETSSEAAEIGRISQVRNAYVKDKFVQVQWMPQNTVHRETAQCELPCSKHQHNVNNLARNTCQKQGYWIFLRFSYQPQTFHFDHGCPILSRIPKCFFVWTDLGELSEEFVLNETDKKHCITLKCFNEIKRF